VENEGAALTRIPAHALPSYVFARCSSSGLPTAGCSRASLRTPPVKGAGIGSTRSGWALVPLGAKEGVTNSLAGPGSDASAFDEMLGSRRGRARRPLWGAIERDILSVLASTPREWHDEAPTVKAFGASSFLGIRAAHIAPQAHPRSIDAREDAMHPEVHAHPPGPLRPDRVVQPQRRPGVCPAPRLLRM
jgi:hypothetical protein